MSNEPINTLELPQIGANEVPNILLFSPINDSEKNEIDSNIFRSNHPEDSEQNDDARYYLDNQTTGPNTGNNRLQQPHIYLLLLIGFITIESRLKGKYTIEASEDKKKEMEEYFKDNIHKTRHNIFGKQIHDKFHGSILIKVIKDAILNRLINSINSILKANNSEIILQKLNYKIFISDISKGNYLKFRDMKLSQYLAYESDEDKKLKNRNKEVINKVCNIIPILKELTLSDYISFFLYEKELDKIIPNVDENIKNAFIRADTLLKDKETALNDEGEKYRLLYILHLFNFKKFFETIKQRKPCKNRKKIEKKKKFLIKKYS